jgi:AmmeMemoRadiSam system protein B
MEAMPEILPRLRMDLDFVPSPVRDRPGLMIRDPYRYSDAALIVPPVLVQCLQLFDGVQTDNDLRAALVQLTGELQVGEVARHLRQMLSEAGFVEDAVYLRRRDEQHVQFARAERREASHAGFAYPEEPEKLRETLGRYMSADPAPVSGLVGIAAPHISPEGGYRTYATAYGALGPEYKDRIFVILGTSHYGEPERFGLTAKPFVTPLGEARTERELVERLAAEGGDAVKLEDYCHAVEHSIEFQVIFLQHLYGPGIRILPVLCGSFAHSIRGGGKPEDDGNVRRFLDALSALAVREGSRLFWVLGIDLAHMGRRYGDLFTARANEGAMAEAAVADRRRIGFVEDGDPAGFWTAVQENGDPLHWCGSAPLYTFLKAVPETRARLLGYEQWNIDEHSVVSFSAMALERRP